MHSLDLRGSPQQIGALALGAGVAAAAIWLLLRRRAVPEEELERRRRAYLARVGRIVDGVVLDGTVIDRAVSDNRLSDEVTGQEALQFILYRYEIAGVVYESSQDVTHLADYVDVQNCRLDLPASIRYDAGNPANSIVISETWNGLRSGSGERKPFSPSAD